MDTRFHGYDIINPPVIHAQAGIQESTSRIMDTRFHGYDIINPPVIPAQAGIQESSSAAWIPVFTGMTSLSHLSFPRKRESRKAHPQHGYPFSRV